MTAKRILISGGAGFLGSHLADYYVGKGWEVVIIDNLSTGRKRNIRHLLRNPAVTYATHDICRTLPKKLRNLHYDVIANLASPASPPQYQRLAMGTLRVASEGTLNLLEIATRDKARFFHASTSEVYGDPDVHPQPESYRGSVNCYGPRSMYDEGKRYAEALVYVFQTRRGTNTCIGRFFNTYGPRMDPADGRVVSNLIVQALRKEPMSMYGDGSQTRSFCYVTDLIAGIAKLIDSGVHEPINLGNPKEFTILELAHIIQDLTGFHSKITHTPLPADDPLQRQPVIDKAQRLLKWQPTVSLKEGLSHTIAHFVKELHLPNPLKQ